MAVDDSCEYELVDSFGIDNGELKDLSNTDAFVLGVEWAMFREQLNTDSNEFSTVIHPDNVSRIRGLASKRGRKIDISWEFNGVVHDGWFRVTVYPKVTLQLV